MPRRKSSFADNLILAPWWVSFALAIIALIVSTGLPPAFRTLGKVGVFLLFALSAISALRSVKNAWTLNRQTGLDSIRELSSKRFEDLLGEAYRRQGYAVEETLGGGADGGVDLVLRRDGEVTLVQCKRWKARPVPVQTVRELYGVLHDRGANAAKLVATTRFTSEAAAFAKDKPMELVNQDALLELITGVQSTAKIAPVFSSAEPDHLTPACPSCGKTMTLRTARRGANAGERFWGCPSYPKCRGTRSKADH
ncbi:MAG: restriction endonuclease [Chthoniobacterales bacterium]